MKDVGVMWKLNGKDIQEKARELVCYIVRFKMLFERSGHSLRERINRSMRYIYIERRGMSEKCRQPSSWSWEQRPNAGFLQELGPPLI